MCKLMYACDCGADVSEHDLREEVAFYATMECPAEYNAYCPECGTDFQNMEQREEYCQ